MKQLRVAIDGPAGAGKSTAAKLVAKELALPYIDTGAMYRAVTWKALQLGMSLDEEDKVTELASRLDIAFIANHEQQSVLVDGEIATEQIRSPEVTERVSQVAAIRGVRAEMVKLQQRIANRQGVVMDGRDIGTHVIPDAEVKIFLTASLQERAKRRKLEMENKGIYLSQDELETSIARRDELDSSRDVAPLRQAEDAHLIDTTGQTAAEVAERILGVCKDFLGTNQ
jgi:cytidylate kinase